MRWTLLLFWHRKMKWKEQKRILHGKSTVCACFVYPCLRGLSKTIVSLWLIYNTLKKKNQTPSAWQKHRHKCPRGFKPLVHNFGQFSVRAHLQASPWGRECWVQEWRMKSPTTHFPQSWNCFRFDFNVDFKVTPGISSLCPTSNWQANLQMAPCGLLHCALFPAGKLLVSPLCAVCSQLPLRSLKTSSSY